MRPSDSEKEFERLVTEHRATIYTVCYMFSKDADEVADLFQEVLVNLWRGMCGFEGRSDVRTWIYRVSLNTCVSHDRKRRRAKTVPLSIDINLFEDSDAESQQVRMLYDRISAWSPSTAPSYCCGSRAFLTMKSAKLWAFHPKTCR